MTTCIHCNANLTAKDLADGWCDSCGKRLPSMITAKPKAATPAPQAAEEAPAASGWGWVAWSTGAAVLLALGAVAVVASKAFAG